MKIEVAWYSEGGEAIGGLVLPNDIAIPLLLSARLVEVSIGAEVAHLSREEALDVADAIRSAALDG